MNQYNKIYLIIIMFLFMTESPMQAQTWEEREEERHSSNTGFWDWLFSDIDIDIWDESVNVNDVYHNVVLRINLSRQWKFSIGDNENWATSTYNDQQWENIKVPADWENEGFNGYDGYAWYRIHFDGRTLKGNQSHYLILGFIDDVDETFLNGKLIGKSGEFPRRFRTAYNHDRRYFIPSEHINFNGDNVIAVRIYDARLNGGIVSGKPGIYTSNSTENLLLGLYGQWKFTQENRPTFRQYSYNDQQWKNILVPSFWDNQGYRSLDGIAWYRKHFDLCFNPQREKTYYLALGNIDDFDITYLNGVEIGRTDDKKGYGQSKSYQQMRIYKIPEGLLKTEAENVIAVKVYDIGHEGGIYKGPIGIIEEADITRLMRQRN